MEIRIQTLSENTASYGFLGEWGLSILVEVDGIKVLMDTGLSYTSVYNAQLMGVDLNTIDRIVLSHGHADHTGGLREVLRRRSAVDVIAHPDIWTTKYSRRSSNARESYSGIPFSQQVLESLGARFNHVKEPFHITNNIITSGEVPMTTEYEKIEDNLFVKENGILHQDKMADDLALIIDTEFGLVVILGCAHRGIINTLRHAQNLTGKELVYAAIGGTHLYRASDERIEKTIADLKTMEIQRLGVSHCTGFRASTMLAREFEDVFFLNNSGTRFTLP